MELVLGREPSSRLALRTLHDNTSMAFRQLLRMPKLSRLDSDPPLCLCCCAKSACLFRALEYILSMSRPGSTVAWPAPSHRWEIWPFWPGVTSRAEAAAEAGSINASYRGQGCSKAAPGIDFSMTHLCQITLLTGLLCGG